MNTNCNCDCSTAPKLIFACFGAADVGAVADLGMNKGETDVNDENIAKAVFQGASLLQEVSS